MALCVRKVDRKHNWHDPRWDEPWLGINDLRADALRDLQTEENKLSIWEMNDDIPLSRVLAAVAASREFVAKLDFIVFEFGILDELKMERERVSGNTHDVGVNDRHIDLIHLSARKLSEFGARIRAAGKADRYYPKSVAPLIQDSVDRGFIDWNALEPRVAEKIQAQRPAGGR